MRIIPSKRILKFAVLTGSGIVVLLLLFLAFLPTLISSDTVQSRIQRTLSSTLKRQVAWSRCAVSWSDGLTLSKLKFGDGAAPLLTSEVDLVHVAPSLGRGSDGRVAIDLVVKIINVRAELAPGPPKPPPPPSGKDPLTLLAEMIQKIQGLDYPLPVDLRVQVEIAPLNISYRAPAPGKHLQLNDFSFRLAMPSLATEPVVVGANGRVTVDGREMGKVRLDAKVSKLVTKERRIHLASALCAVDAAAPGTNLSLSGGLSQADGFSAHWKLDLPRLLAVTGPFMPPAVPELSGTLQLLLRANVDAERDLHAIVMLEGAGLAAGGGALKAKRVGPLDVKLQQRIVTDHTRQRVEFPGGSCVIPDLLNVAWSASVINPTVTARSLELQFGPLRLDLARGLSLARPFLPPETPVRDLAGELFLRSLNLRLNGTDNRGNCAIDGFGVKLPRVRLALTGGELAAENVELLLQKAVFPLTKKLPTALTAELLWSVGKAARSGVEPLTFRGAKGTLSAVVSDLNLKSTSPRKVAAAVTLTQNADCERVALGSRMMVEKVHEQLRLSARAGETGALDAQLQECSVTAGALQMIQAGKRLGPLPFSASVTADGLHLSPDTGAAPTFQHATASLSSGDFFQLAAQATRAPNAPLRATTVGNARLDLRRALPFAAPFLPSGVKGGGIVTAAWDLTAPLVKPAPSTDKHPLRTARAALAQLDKLDLRLKLENISATLPSEKGAITVSDLHTSPVLHVVSANKGETVTLDGGILFSGLDGLPGTSGKLPPQQGVFEVNGELSGWKDLRLREECRLASPALSHEAELNISHLNSLLEEKLPFHPATLLKRLDATLLATVDGAFSREMKQLLPGLYLAGDLGSSIRVDLNAGRELALRLSLKTADFGVQLANGTKVEGLRSDIMLQRSYALADKGGEAWAPLSASLVRPAIAKTTNPGAAEIVGRIHNDLRGETNGVRSFSIRRITTVASRVPLVLSAVEGDLLFGQEKAGLGFFQADLLGGTLLARSTFDLKPEIPVLTAASSFSNLDITRLLPQEARTQSVNRDAEITGELSFSAPLTAEQRELSEQLRLGMNLRKIGVNTLERALYALDPYERNEQVVAQRKMLRLGSLKWLRASAVDGAFSMDGEAVVKGVALQLPKVERLRISELPLRQELVKYKKTVAALRGLLDLVRADLLVIGPKGEVALKRRTYEK